MNVDLRDAGRTLSSIAILTFLTQALQFAYGLITARVLGPSAFGTYAAALVLVGIAPLLLAGPFATTVAFSRRLTVRQIRSLASASVFAGLLLWGGYLLVSPLWFRLWGVDVDWLLVLIMSVMVLLAGTQSMLVGLARRGNRVGSLAAATAVANLVGMVLGLACVLGTKDPAALGVQPAVAISCVVLLHPLWLRGRLRLGYPRLWHGSGRVTSIGDSVFQLADYSIGNAAGWLMGAHFGPYWLGVWNRATAFASSPIMVLRSAGGEVLMSGRLTRRRRAGFVGRRVAVAGLASSILVGLLIGLLLTAVVPWLLGPDWQATTYFLLPIALAAAVSVACTPAVVSMRARGEQKGLLIRLIGSAVVLLAFLATAVATGDPIWTGWGCVAQQVVLWFTLEVKSGRN